MLYRVSSIFGRGVAVIFVMILLGLLAACGGIRKPGSQNQQDLLSETSPVAPIKISIREEGIYEISLSSIKAIAPWITDLNGIQLLNQGKTQKVWIDTIQPSRWLLFWKKPEQKLFFYGRSVDNRYAKDNVYWLIPTGLEKTNFPKEIFPQLVERNNADDSLVLNQYQNGIGTTDYFYDTIKFEENQIYRPLATQVDRWFWVSMTAPQEEVIDFDLDEVVSGTAHFRALLWGGTEAKESPDHHLVIELNGWKIADHEWDGKGTYLLDAEIPREVIVSGSNQVRLILPGFSHVAADVILLDWFEISYPRSFIAKNNRLKFISSVEKVSLKGFADSISLFDITNPDSVERIASSIKPTNEMIVLPDHQYLAVSIEGYLNPIDLKVVKFDPILLRPDNEVDYIAIGPKSFLKPLKPLLDLRKQQGYRVMAISWEEVMDQFGWGIPDPQAVRNLLAYAKDHWATSPEYLLLLGDASYDPKNFLNQAEGHQLPTFLIDTSLGGETGSDLGFANPSFRSWLQIQTEVDTEEPSVAVGRIPARDPRQLAIMVEKTIGYEESIISSMKNPSSWLNNVLIISDGQDGSFDHDARVFQESLPDAITANVLSTVPDKPDQNNAIIEQINQGYLLTVYFGHGSSTMWGKDQLFSIKDVSALTNKDRLTIVWNFTCLTGLFLHPQIESLAETLLWKQEGGAVAVLAPTSLTLPSDQSFLSNNLVNAMHERPEATIGEIILSAQKHEQGKTPGGQDVFRTFLLFGDPALRIDIGSVDG